MSPPTPELPPAFPEVRCLICGNGIQPGNSVDCQKCETPHHRDCFEFNGRCAVFGCGCTHFALPWQRTLRPTKSPLPMIIRNLPSSRAVAVRRQEIHIEATRPFRTLGLTCLGFGGYVTSLAALPSCSGAGGELLGQSLQLFEFGEFGVILIALIFFPLILWILLRFTIPFVTGVLGYATYYCDNSYWLLDPVKGRLTLHGKVLGLTFWKRSWAVSSLDEIIVGPLKFGDTWYLTIRLKNGRQVWLADNRSHERVGYSQEDLERLGGRLSEATGVQLRTVSTHPVLPSAEPEPLDED